MDDDAQEHCGGTCVSRDCVDRAMEQNSTKRVLDGSIPLEEYGGQSREVARHNGSGLSGLTTMIQWGTVTTNS